jgi:hypothetical protein
VLIIRRFKAIASLGVLFIPLMLLTACGAQEAMPTLAVLPTDIPATQAAPSPTVPAAQAPGAEAPGAEASATPIPTLPRPTATSLRPKPSNTPSVAPTAAPVIDGDAVNFDDLTTQFKDRRITFFAFFTPRKALAREVTLSYTYPSTGGTQQWKAPVPKQTLGEQINTPLQYSIGVTAMPKGEDRILYTWQVTTDSGAVQKSEEKTFKVTEAILADRKDNFPVIKAEQTFQSNFPDEAVFTVTLNPDPPIQNASFYLTQNSGIQLYNFAVRVPTQKAGEPLTLQFTWNDQLGLQIPWQEFETWWVFYDQMGHKWRTEHAFNDYADNRFHRWTLTPTKHAALYTYGQNKASINTLMKATDDSIERLEKVFGYRLIYTPHIVVYNQQRDFEDWAPPMITEQFIGMASGEWGGVVVTYYESLDYTGYSIIQHELVHLFQFQSIRESAPQYWIEGSARYFEEVPYDDYEGYVRKSVKAYGAPDLGYRVPDYPPDGSGVPWPYYVGMTFVKYIILTYGDEAFAQLHIAMARDMTFTDALKTVLGKTLPQLNTEWAVWISQ